MYLLTRTATKSTMAPCADRQQDAAECFDAYLEVLVEELVAPRTSISTGKLKPESSLKSEELEEGTQPGEGQTEVGRREGESQHSAPILILSTI
jgi:hypothetical protein